MPAWSTLSRTLSSSLAIIAKRQLPSMQQPCFVHSNVRGLPPLLPYRASSSHALLAQPSQPRFGGPTEASVDRLHTNALSSSHRMQGEAVEVLSLFRLNLAVQSETGAVCSQEGSTLYGVKQHSSGCSG